MTLIIYTIIAVLMAALSMIILAGKGDGLIAGYNTAREQEKRQVNIKRLRLVVGVTLLAVTAVLLLPVFIGQEGNPLIYLATTVLITVITIIALLLANTWCKKK